MLVLRQRERFVEEHTNPTSGVVGIYPRFVPEKFAAAVSSSSSDGSSESLSISVKAAIVAITVLGVTSLVGVVILVHFHRCKVSDCSFCHWVRPCCRRNAKKWSSSPAGATMSEILSIHSRHTYKIPRTPSGLSFNLNQSPLGFHFPIETGPNSPLQETHSGLPAPEYLESDAISPNKASVVPSSNRRTSSSIYNSRTQVKTTDLKAPTEEGTGVSPAETQDHMSFITLPSFVQHTRSRSTCSSVLAITPATRSSRRSTIFWNEPASVIPPVPTLMSSLSPRGSILATPASAQVLPMLPALPKNLVPGISLPGFTNESEKLEENRIDSQATDPVLARKVVDDKRIREWESVVPSTIRPILSLNVPNPLPSDNWDESVLIPLPPSPSGSYQSASSTNPQYPEIDTDDRIPLSSYDMSDVLSIPSPSSPSHSNWSSHRHPSSTSSPPPAPSTTYSHEWCVPLVPLLSLIPGDGSLEDQTPSEYQEPVSFKSEYASRASLSTDLYGPATGLSSPLTTSTMMSLSAFPFPPEPCIYPRDSQDNPVSVQSMVPMSLPSLPIMLSSDPSIPPYISTLAASKVRRPLPSIPSKLSSVHSSRVSTWYSATPNRRALPAVPVTNSEASPKLSCAGGIIR